MLWYQLHQLKSSDESRRRDAIRKLGVGGNLRAVDTIVTALSDDAFLVRAEAAGALGRFRNAGTIKPLEAALGDEYAIVREAVVRALQAIGGSAVIRPLVSALEDRDADVRRTASDALNQMEDAEAKRAILDYMRREEESRRLAEQSRQEARRQEETRRLADQARRELERKESIQRLPEPQRTQSVHVDAIVILFNRDFASRNQFVDEILTSMKARGHSYRHWMRRDTKLNSVTVSDAQSPVKYMAMAAVQFRVMLNGVSDLKDVEIAKFQGSDGINGVILSHWTVSPQ